MWCFFLCRTAPKVSCTWIRRDKKTEFSWLHSAILWHLVLKNSTHCNCKGSKIVKTKEIKWWRNKIRKKQVSKWKTADKKNLNQGLYSYLLVKKKLVIHSFTSPLAVKYRLCRSLKAVFWCSCPAHLGTAAKGHLTQYSIPGDESMRAM